MYYKKLEGKRIFLSPISLNDYQMITKWMNDESVSCGLGNFKYNVTELAEREYLENSSRKGDYQFAIIRKEDYQMIGIYNLELKDDASKRFFVGGFIGELSDRGKGFGTEALSLITKYAFDGLNAQTIYSGIYAFNLSSLKSAQKVGYQVIGKFRNSYYYNGTYYDEINIEFIREDYIKLRKNII